VLGRRGGMRGRELAAWLGQDPSPVTRLSSSQAALKTSMASSQPQNSCEFIAISYPS
jgi:hypothetical protein